MDRQRHSMRSAHDPEGYAIRFLQRHAAEAQGVGDHGDGTEGHGGAGDDGAEENAEKRRQRARSQRNTQRIINEREEEVLPNVAHDGTAQAAGASNAPQVTLQERDAGAFDGDIGATAHGDAHLRLRQRRGIIDAVAGHGHNATLALQLPDDLALLLRQDFRLYFVDPKFFCDRLGSSAAVAGQHHDADAFFVQKPDRFRRGFLNGIHYAEDTSGPAINHDEHYRLTFLAQGLRAPLEWRSVRTQFGCEPPVAKRDPAAVHNAGDSLAGDRLEVAGLDETQTLVARARDDCLGQRMLACALEACGEAQQIALIPPLHRLDGNQARLAFRKRAGLVHYDRVNFLEHFKAFGVFNQHAR